MKHDFTLAGTRAWLTDNPCERFEVPLHDAKIDVRCAVAAQRIVNSEVYETERLQTFVEQLADKKQEYAFLHHEGATAHTSWFSMAYVHEIFEKERTISAGLSEHPIYLFAAFICGVTKREK
ncbi:hypothetical protein TNCV_928831 [Trichonephila clavipes]|nr:hypothetical protein TNCV_928831 [Trichonephila clavipes]